MIQQLLSTIAEPRTSLALLDASAAGLGLPVARPEPGGPDMTRYVLVCFLLLGLIGFAAYLFRRFISASVRARASKRSLQIVDLLPLGGKQRLCVVRCYDRTFALGLGDKEVSLIAELDAEATPAAKSRAPFAALLRREQDREIVPQSPGSHRGEVAAPELGHSPAPKRRNAGTFSLGNLFG